jgi:hypothetical protein
MAARRRHHYLTRFVENAVIPMAKIAAIWKKAQRLLPLTFQTASPQWVLDLGQMVDLPLGYFPTNPSILNLDGKFLVCVRGVNYTLEHARSMKPKYTGEKRFRTINKFFLMSTDFTVIRTLPALDGVFSDIADVKLFACGDAIYGMGSRVLDPEGKAYCMTLVKISGDLTSTSSHDIPSPFKLRQEKNWSPFDHEGSLCFVYCFHPLIILKYRPEASSVEFWQPEHAAHSPRSLSFLVSGSSPGLEILDGYLFVAHRRSVRLPRLNRAYMNRLYHLDRRGTAVTGGPYFVIEEPAIQFVNGLHMDARSVYVSYGRNDHSAHLACFRKSDFLKSFIPPGILGETGWAKSLDRGGSQQGQQKILSRVSR